MKSFSRFFTRRKLTESVVSVDRRGSKWKCKDKKLEIEESCIRGKSWITKAESAIWYTIGLQQRTLRPVYRNFFHVEKHSV